MTKLEKFLDEKRVKAIFERRFTEEIYNLLSVKDYYTINGDTYCAITMAFYWEADNVEFWVALDIEFRETFEEAKK